VEKDPTRTDARRSRDDEQLSRTRKGHDLLVERDIKGPNGNLQKKSPSWLFKSATGGGAEEGVDVKKVAV